MIDTLSRKFAGKMAAGAVVALMAATGAAIAADSPRGAPPAPVAAAEPVFAPAADWSGIYLGVHGSWSQFSVDGAGGENDFADFGGGGQIGFNYQFSPHFVAGLEADYSFIEETGTQGTGGGAFYTSTVDGLGSARVRLGVVPMDNILLYATGGVAFGEITSFASPSGTTDETNVGWVIGAGIEGLVTENITARAEYLYYDLGELNVPGAADVTVNTVRLGLNYKFNPF